MASPSASAATTNSSQPPQYRVVGVLLAVGSGLLIGSSFVFKKKGLLSSQKGHAAGEGVAYLKSPMWWTGMIIMILGEICNFVAYAFVEAIVVTPLGALSVVISALLSHFFLNEKLSLFGWISSVQCLLGATILALNGPEEQSVNTIIEFRKLFVTPWFLAYGGVVLISAAILALWVAPRWGHKSMLPYLGVCSLIGGLSVSCTQGLGACILTSIRGNNQNWFIYFLLVFVIITLLTEIYYLNIALAMYNTGAHLPRNLCYSSDGTTSDSYGYGLKHLFFAGVLMKFSVTPTYYVSFTFCTLLTSVILYQGLKASASQIITIVLAFAVICTGIFILQMSKVDPRTLTNVDERTTLLLEAARQEVNPHAGRSLELRRSGTLRSRRSRPSTGHPQSIRSNYSTDVLNAGPTVASPIQVEGSLGITEHTDCDDDEQHAIVEKTEEPGLDSLRGVAGALGTLIRARRRIRELSTMSAGRNDEEGYIPAHIRDAGSQDNQILVGSSTGWLNRIWSTSRGTHLRTVSSDDGGKDAEKALVEVVEDKGIKEEKAEASTRRPSPDRLEAVVPSSNIQVEPIVQVSTPDSATNTVPRIHFEGGLIAHT